MQKVLLVGNGGRESSIAWKLSGECVLYAVMQHANPTIVKHVEASGGEYAIGNVNDKQLITNFAKSKKIDLAFITGDAPLEAGVIDALKKAGILTVGPTRKAAEIEWNKAFAMDLVRKILPKYTPKYWICRDKSSLHKVFSQIIKADMPIVVKPQGLTGGKGVKVMGEHLKDFVEAQNYAWDLIKKNPGEKVIIEEKLSGPEFTLQVLTDGENIIEPPASYDHPYRFNLDRGPGTGGMGSFTDVGLPLPFMREEDYRESIKVTKTVLRALRGKGLDFSGVLYPGFFLTPRGIRITEFNARFGDPECMNIMMVLDGSFLEILQKIAKRTLKPCDVSFKPVASVVKYLVSPEYAIKEGREREFFLDERAIEAHGVSVFFSSAVSAGAYGKYKSVGNSRVVALVASGKTIPEAARKVDQVIKKYVKGPLEYRSDIGTAQELKRLTPTPVNL